MTDTTNLMLDRLAAAMKDRNVNQSDLARAVGATPAAVQQILSGATRRSRLMPDIARVLGVNLDWLTAKDAMGGGAMEDGRDGYVSLLELDLSYGMGGGTFLDEQDPDATMAVFDPRWLNTITTSPPSLLFIARGAGDSMMPTILDNDTLLIDRGQRRITQQDRIWTLSYGGLGMIKRVRRTPKGMFLLMSDNPAISTIEATEDELHVVGRLAWIGRKT